MNDLYNFYSIQYYSFSSSTSSPLPRSTRNRSFEVWSPQTIEQILEVVNRQKASVLYYSLAAGFLYAWLIIPM